MKDTKLRLVHADSKDLFENLVSYERYKTLEKIGKSVCEFENLVSYERYKTKKILQWIIYQFENLVSYERYRGFKKFL